MIQSLGRLYQPSRIWRIVRQRVDALPEVLIGPGAAEVAAAGTEILRRPDRQIAVRVEVPVGIGPRPRRGRREARRRQQRRVVPVAADGHLQIPARVELEGRLPGPEQVVGHAEPRVDVVVPDDPCRFREGERPSAGTGSGQPAAPDSSSRRGRSGWPPAPSSSRASIGPAHRGRWTGRACRPRTDSDSA